jgi:hypothetical protein
MIRRLLLASFLACGGIIFHAEKWVRRGRKAAAHGGKLSQHTEEKRRQLRQQQR